MPIITVDLFEGRTRRQRQALADGAPPNSSGRLHIRRQPAAILLLRYRALKHQSFQSVLPQPADYWLPNK